MNKTSQRKRPAPGSPGGEERKEKKVRPSEDEERLPRELLNNVLTFLDCKMLPTMVLLNNFYLNQYKDQAAQYIYANRLVSNLIEFVDGRYVSLVNVVLRSRTNRIEGFMGSAERLYARLRQGWAVIEPEDGVVVINQF